MTKITHTSELPPPVNRIVRSMMVWMDLVTKIPPSTRGSDHLIEVTRIDAGYCLDALDELPAGGCASETVDLGDGDPPFGMAVQLTVEREQ